jgi:hypothetical protein
LIQYCHLTANPSGGTGYIFNVRINLLNTARYYRGVLRLASSAVEYAAAAE